MLNTTKKRIALVGSAPASVLLAPYDDPDWFVMGCSPGAYPHAILKADAWTEAHRWEPQVPGKVGSGKPWFSPEYQQCLRQFKGTVWTGDPVPVEIPNGRAIPARQLLDKYGPYFFSSSLAWMFAMALETPGVEEIGLWGVDMSAQEEYAAQRPGCHHFITLAMERGIKITVPPESDLLQPGMIYGVTENNPMFIKLQERQRELQGRKIAADQRLAQAQNESTFLTGALDDLDYMLKTWVTHQVWIQPTLGETGTEPEPRMALHAVGDGVSGD